LPGYDNVYVGTGGGSKGILVSSGIGHELVNFIEGNPTNKYDFMTPGRFHVPG
jgi:glycine/D-amino acid oxidase-like deaminating enzyme